MSSGMLLVVMGGLFLLLGYMGVPVAFAIIAGVLVVTAFTPISFQSMIGQLFHGIDSEALLAVPFFLLVGELMSSANVIHAHDPLLPRRWWVTCAAAWPRSSRCSACSSPASRAPRPPTSRC